MRFAIRDDDVNYYTTLSDLKAAYGSLLGSIPISFGVIPFLGGGECLESIKRLSDIGVLDNQWEKWLQKSLSKPRAIEENSNLISFLKSYAQEGKAEIMMHGIHHAVSEFERYTVTPCQVEHAKTYLGQVFGHNITTFTPPNNTLSGKGAEAVIRNRMDILSSFGYYPWERPFEWRNWLNFAILAYWFLRYGKFYRYPHVLPFKRHKEFYCYTFSSSTCLQHLKRQVEFAFERNGDFCLATHYYVFIEHPELKTILLSFIDFCKARFGQEIQFATVSEIFSGNLENGSKSEQR